MALTQKKLQALEGQGFRRFFDEHRALWKEKSLNAYRYAVQGLPAGQEVRIDDVAAVMLPAIEIDIVLRKFLQNARLPQQYWNSYFCDYVLDLLWQELRTGSEEGGSRNGRRPAE